MRNTYTILFAAAAVAGLASFEIGIYFPITLSVVMLAAVSLYILQEYREKRIGLLIIIAWLTYLLPFIHIPPYISFDFNSNPTILWGLAVNPYMLDEQVIKLTAMIGAIGAIGIAFGISLSRQKIKQNLYANTETCHFAFDTMGLPIWLAWVVIGLLLSSLSAPQETIFTAAYTDSKSALDGANFSSAWMVSYVILSYAFCDALLEQKKSTRLFKVQIINFTIILVVVFLQLLRGDRECLPWVLGLFIAKYYWAKKINPEAVFKIAWAKLIILVLLIFVISLVVGGIRSGLVNSSLSDAIWLIGKLLESGSNPLDLIIHGTWSAVLLTPLSVAGDHIYGFLPLKMGQDYLDLLLSIIPGFVADAIGYIRPIDSLHGPAWEMRYGIGGTHSTVVPFMNFRMIGVFFISAIWALIIVIFEKWSIKHAGVSKLSLLVTISMGLPHWLWYGEKAGINMMSIWFVFWALYRISLSLDRSSPILH